MPGSPLRPFADRAWPAIAVVHSRRTHARARAPRRQNVRPWGIQGSRPPVVRRTRGGEPRGRSTREPERPGVDRWTHAALRAPPPAREREAGTKCLGLLTGGQHNPTPHEERSALESVEFDPWEYELSRGVGGTAGNRRRSSKSCYAPRSRPLIQESRQSSCGRQGHSGRCLIGFDPTVCNSPGASRKNATVEESIACKSDPTVCRFLTLAVAAACPRCGESAIGSPPAHPANEGKEETGHIAAHNRGARGDMSINP